MFRNFGSSILALLIVLFFACKKDSPDRLVAPVIATPSPDVGLVDNCNGYWFCLKNHSFKVVQNTSVRYESGAFSTCASLKQKAFFAGGHEEGYIGFVQADLNIYDFSRERWEHLNLSVPRSHLASATAGNKILFAGGANVYSANPVYPSVLEYYSTVDILDYDSYNTTVAQLSEMRGFLTSASAGNKAFFIGGKTIDGYSSKMDIYDASNGQWTVIDLPRERAYASAVVNGSKIYICGGSNGSGNLKIVDVYDYITSQWSTFTAPHDHFKASAISVGENLYLAGGNGSNEKFVDILTFGNNKWTSAELTDARFDIAVAAANGKVIFFGGNYSFNVDVYDIASDKWSVAILSDGVTGVAAGSMDGKCIFTGFLYNKGNAITNGAIIIEP